MMIVIRGGFWEDLPVEVVSVIVTGTARIGAVVLGNSAGDATFGPVGSYTIRILLTVFGPVAFVANPLRTGHNHHAKRSQHQNRRQYLHRVCRCRSWSDGKLLSIWKGDRLLS